jgi:fructan beta-fructosidase
LQTDLLADCSATFSNQNGEKLIVGFDKAKNQYFIDRTKSGKVDFSDKFSQIAYAPRISMEANSELLLIFDQSSVELFADGGRTVMTSIFFPSKPLAHLNLKSFKVTELVPLSGIW